ncbi:MAG: BrnT family toxin [Nitrospira sp.]
MDGSVSGFDWDEGNLAKCQKHGVSVSEIEGLFKRGITIFPDAGHSHSEERMKGIGKTGHGRYIFLVFTVRGRAGKKYIRPISARYMHKKEIEGYEKETSEA